MSKHESRIVCLSNMYKQLNKQKKRTKMKSIKLQHLRK